MSTKSPLVSRLSNRLGEEYERFSEKMAILSLRFKASEWPSPRQQILLVGCESSGTTAISRLMLRDGTGRFLYEGGNHWVWDACNAIYQRQTTLRDYPRLQIYDRMKIPRFASILDQYVEAYPNVKIVYVLRDPRDVVVSACKTFKVTTENGLSDIPWVTESWLGIEDQEPVARLARRWAIFLEQSQKTSGVCYVRYEDFCQDKVGSILDAAKQLDIACDRERLLQLCDSQASPPSTRDYKPAGPGGWKSGMLRDSDIETIQEICGDGMRQWGYL